MTLAPSKINAIVTALEYIHEHPDEWNQGEWMAFLPPGREYTTTLIPVEVFTAGSCGTVACLAGHIALRQPEFTQVPSHDIPGYIDGVHVTYKGEYLYVSNAVTDYLLEGSTDPEDDREGIEALFVGSNTEHELWFLAQQLTEKVLTPPPGVDVEQGRLQNEGRLTEYDE